MVPDVAEGYGREGREDPRFRDDLLAESVVTRGRGSDAGLFRRDYDDDRYLPFEGVGLADSLWRVDLFADTGVDVSDVDDVEIAIDYSARDGGERDTRFGSGGDR